MPARTTLDPVTTPSAEPESSAVAAGPLLRRVPRSEPALEHGPQQSRLIPAPPIRRGSAAVPARPRRDPVAPAALVRAQQIFRLTFEVLEGRRGPHQLQPLMVPDVVAKITTMARVSVGQRLPTTARLYRVHVQQVTPRAAEACVSVERGGRVRAVAARLELAKSGWRCTALMFG